MPTDRQTLKDALVGVLGSKPAAEMSDARATVNLANSFTVSKAFSDAATAATAVTESTLFRAPYACKVISVYVTTPIGVTEAAANTATFTVAKRTAGGSATTIATGQTITTTGIGSFTAHLPKAITMTPSAAILAAGDAVTFAVSKQSSGVALTAVTSVIDVTVLVEAI